MLLTDFELTEDATWRKTLWRQTGSSVVGTEVFLIFADDRIQDMSFMCIWWLKLITKPIKAFVSPHTETPSMKRHYKGGDINKEKPATLLSLISWFFVLGLKKNVCDLHFKTSWSKTITLLLLYFSLNKWIRLQALVSTGFSWPCCTDNIWSFLQ